MPETPMYYVYILARGYRGYLYVGLTNHLSRRLTEHLNGQFASAYTLRRNITDLVYYEMFASAKDAAKREQQLKRFSRASKFKLIEQANPNWHSRNTETLQRYPIDR